MNLTNIMSVIVRMYWNRLSDSAAIGIDNLHFAFESDSAIVLIRPLL